MSETPPQLPGRDAAPSNSQRQRQPHKLAPVVKNPTSTRQPSIWRKASGLLNKEDASSVASYVFFEVILPSVRTLIFDAGSQALQRTLFGDSAPRRSSGYGGYSSPSYSYTPYNRPTTSVRTYNGQSQQQKQPTVRTHRPHEFETIILATRQDAEAVLDNLYEILGTYEMVTVSSLYELANITGPYTNDKWGWTSLDGARIVPVREGFLLELPPIRPLN